MSTMTVEGPGLSTGRGTAGVRSHALVHARVMLRRNLRHMRRYPSLTLMIIGMPLVNLLHRIRIRRSPLLISLPRVLIKFAQGCDVILFTRSGR